MGIFNRKPNIEKLEANKNVDGLIKALKHKNNAVRCKAARILGEFKNDRAKDHLIKALMDKDENVQYEAVVALGKIKSTEAVDSLIQAKVGDRAGIKKIWALGEIKDKRAIEYLINSRKKDKMENKRLEGWKTIFGNMVKDKTELALLIQAKKEIYTDIRKQATIALGKIGDARAVEPLIEGLKDEDMNVRVEAVKALGEIRDVRAIEPLIKVLKDFWGGIHQKVEETHGPIEFVTQALKDKDIDLSISGEVSEALVKIGEPAIEPLVQTLKTKNVGLRSAVQVTLKNIQKDNER